MDHSSFQESLFRPLPSVDELRQALKESETGNLRDLLDRLFDENTFVELGVYAKRSFSEYAVNGRTNEFEGVICGYGSIAGVLVYVFAEDIGRLKGAIDDTHAKKICALYERATQNGAPVIGIFDSAGADIYSGVTAMAAYGKILRAVSDASGVVPQLAFINGFCTGTLAAMAAMFDLTVVTEGSSFYVNAPAFGGANECMEPLCAITVKTPEEGIDALRDLLYYLPSCAGEGVRPETTPDDLNRMLGNLEIGGDPRPLLAAVADNGVFTELYDSYAFGLIAAFTVIGGVRCGVLACTSASGNRLTSAEARKAAKFVSFLDAFSIPLVTFVDCIGFAAGEDGEKTPFAAELARLAAAYASSVIPKITVILHHAIGGPFTLLGSKAMGADVAYALDVSEIGALSSEASVAFAWNDRITSETSRESLEEDWLRSLSSPVAAASRGEIDDIITTSEIRARICSSLLMLCGKGSVRKKHDVRPY